jgi:adenylate cyclase
MPKPRHSLEMSVVEGRRLGIRTGIFLVWTIVLLAALPPIARLRLFEIPQNWAYDTALQRRMPLECKDLVIVAIDERSTMPEHLGRFPWSRRVYAKVLKALAAARAVGFDIVFSEPESKDSDRAFADALGRHGRCVLAFHIAREVEVSARTGYLPVALPLASTVGPMWVVRQVQLRPPLEVLARAAAGMGFADLQADGDGLYRRAPLLMADETGAVYPHFALELARVAAGLTREQLAANVSRDSVLVGARIPLTSRAHALINYCGPSGTVRVVSFCDVYEGRSKPDGFAGKVVIIGATATGLHDIRPAPFPERGHFYLGVETNASLLRMLLHGPGIKDGSRSPGWMIVAGLAATFCVVAIWVASEPWLGLLVAIVMLGLQVIGFFAAFYGANVVLPFGPAVLATGIGLSWSGWRRIGLERRVVRSQFSAYVSPEVLGELMRDPEVLFRGERREVTLLFADIRGSTALAERLPAERWLDQLNEYLTAMSDVILAHQGYLDKFMGDGIMAVWNAFGNQPQHRDLAVMASIAMLQRLAALNDVWAGRGDREELRIGIGLHSGEAIVGNVGSRHRTQFTAIGDPVNTAARIEAATKEFAVDFVMSEAVVSGLRRQYAIEPLGQVAVRGKTKPVLLYTIAAAKEDSRHAVD